MNLTPEQTTAIASDHDRVLVLAGAGAGKTTVLVERAKRMAAGGEPTVVLTFTRRAAAELQRRIGDIGNVWCGTIHSWCSYLLRRNASAVGLPSTFRVIDGREVDALAQEAATSLGIRAGRMRAATLFNKNPAIRRVYDRLCRNGGMLDYDAIEERAAEALLEGSIQPDVDHLLVDEYQDVTPLQATLLDAAGARTRFSVGSQEQAVFSWRGADPSVMQDEAARERTQVLRLSVNHRCATSIITASNALAADLDLGDARLGDMLARPGTPEGEVVDGFCQDAREMVDTFVADVARHQGEGSVLILVREWKEAELTRGALAGAGINIRMSRDVVGFWRGDTARAIRVLLRYHAGLGDAALPHPLLAALGIANPTPVCAAARAKRIHPLEVVAQSASPAVAQRAQALIDCTGSNPLEVVRAAAPVLGVPHDSWAAAELFDALDGLDFSDAEDAIAERTINGELDLGFDPDGGDKMLTTVHGAKGLEADLVYVTGIDTKRWPAPWAKSPEALKEERRLLYVAATRARRRLYLAGFPRTVKDKLRPFYAPLLQHATTPAQPPFL